MLPALTVERLDAKVRLQKWEKVGEDRRGRRNVRRPERPASGGSRVFQGTSLLSLDQKGRLSMPARHREALAVLCEGKVTVTRHPDGCLVLYPAPVWEEKRAALAKLPYSARAFVRFVLGSAVDLEPDRAGRILIPSELRLMCALDKEVALIGMGEHFELWDRSTLEAREREALAAGLDAADFSF